MAFLPALGDRVRGPLDVVFVTGDAYVDHPSFGVALLGRHLEANGFSVGVVAQPDVESDRDIGWFGAPRLFWGVTSGAVDSMVANYTASGRKRRSDDYTPGGEGGARPDRAVVVYANLVRRHFKNQRIVIGGIEASLRRLAHYDWWQDRVKRSILLDAKADALIYGMAERTLLAYARLCREGRFDDLRDLDGLCHRTSAPGEGVALPSFEEAAAEKEAFHRFFRLFAANEEHGHAKRLIQKTEATFVVQNPPAAPLTAAELDALHALPFERAVHPRDARRGRVKAIETVRFSITTHRGCFGGCRFCSIAPHQGNVVVSRSEESILEEVRALARRADFRGTITDVGGPTANMYGVACGRGAPGGCAGRDCLAPGLCPSLGVDHGRWLRLLARVAEVPGVKHVFVSSGLRHDLVLCDRDPAGTLEALLARHVSGRLKIAPEHFVDPVLARMGKPRADLLRRFRDLFMKTRRGEQFLVCYFIAAHPGATLEDDAETGARIRKELGYRPEQVQLFTPTPSTWSTTMYHTGLDPDGRPVFVERGAKRRAAQKEAILGPDRPGRRR